MKCLYDPREAAGAPLGMFHCPECGEMVLAGVAHPDYDLLEGPAFEAQLRRYNLELEFEELPAPRRQR